jgi:hypothetical protein
MKPVQTTDSNMTLTLSDSNGDRIPDGDLPAERALMYDSTRGETERDARLGFITCWMPDEAEAAQLEAGAAVKLTVWGSAHPPVSVSVTEAVVPEREMIWRGRVEKAIAKLYADVYDHVRERLSDQVDPDRFDLDVVTDKTMPNAGEFVDLWRRALDATSGGLKPNAETDHAETNGQD